MSEYKIFVGSLAYGATDRDLYDLFDKYGAVREAKVCTDRETGRAKGFGFVEYDNYEDMNAALKAADGVEILGRAIICERAKSRGGGRDGGSRGGDRDRGDRGRDRGRDDRGYGGGRRSRSRERYSNRDGDRRRDRSGDRDRRR